MSEPAHEPWHRVFELLGEGRPIESIRSGWRLSDERIADLLLAGHRAGEEVRAEWIAPSSIRDLLLELVDTRPDLSPVQISGAFKGRVSPALVKVLRVVRNGGRGLDTRIYNEETYFAPLHDDVHGARRELLFVAPEVKARHWARFLDAFRRVRDAGGRVAFFVGRVSELIQDELRDMGVDLIEKRTHANFVIIDGSIVWEGSLNFLLPPAGEEHVRRSVSHLLADELRDLHDLWV